MGGYLDHRIRLAGCELPLFEPTTVEAIYQASNGLTRKANLLTHHALFAATLAKAKSITTEHIQAALQEVAQPDVRCAAMRPGRASRSGLSHSVARPRAAEMNTQSERSSRWRHEGA